MFCYSVTVSVVFIYSSYLYITMVMLFLFTLHTCRVVLYTINVIIVVKLRMMAQFLELCVFTPLSLVSDLDHI